MATKKTKTMKDVAVLETMTTQQNVVVSDANGNVNTVTPGALAQVAAELMPTATAESKGLMSAKMAKRLIPLCAEGTDQTRRYIKITMSGKLNVLVGCIGNYGNSQIWHVGLLDGEHIMLHKIISVGNDFTFKFEEQGGNTYLYVSGLYTWGECSVLPFCGTVSSVERVASIPDTAVALNPS